MTRSEPPTAPSVLNLALNMAMNAAKAGQTCAIFSLEMTGPQLALRALAAETGIDSHRLRLGLYNVAQEELIYRTAGELSDLPIFVDDTPYQGMVEIRGKARRLALERKLDLNQYQGGMCISGRLTMPERTPRHLISPLGPNRVGTDSAV